MKISINKCIDFYQPEIEKTIDKCKVGDYKKKLPDINKLCFEIGIKYRNNNEKREQYQKKLSKKIEKIAKKNEYDYAKTKLVAYANIIIHYFESIIVHS